jgi:hypothetical protein
VPTKAWTMSAQCGSGGERTPASPPHRRKYATTARFARVASGSGGAGGGWGDAVAVVGSTAALSAVGSPGGSDGSGCGAAAAAAAAARAASASPGASPASTSVSTSSSVHTGADCADGTAVGAGWPACPSLGVAAMPSALPCSLAPVSIMERSGNKSKSAEAGGRAAASVSCSVQRADAQLSHLRRARCCARRTTQRQRDGCNGAMIRFTNMSFSNFPRKAGSASDPWRGGELVYLENECGESGERYERRLSIFTGMAPSHTK